MADEKTAKPESGVSQINIKIGDEELKGNYSNLLRIAHTRESMLSQECRRRLPHRYRDCGPTGTVALDGAC